jgi:hypothetical protein
MRYYRNNSYNSSRSSYDSTGRYRSEAWHEDGGANDEGYTQDQCHTCGEETEHERGECIPCADRDSRVSQR